MFDTLHRRKAAGILSLACLLTTQFAHGAVTFIGRAVIPGGSSAGADLSGLANVPMENGELPNRLDGIGSGIAYTGVGNTFVLLPDRGPNNVNYTGSNAVDDTVSYKNRFQVFTITLAGSGNSYTVTPTLVHTSLLTNQADQNFLGLSSAFASGDPTQNRRLDSEGIRVAPDGTVYISDEYGPNIYHFDQLGHRLDSLPVPANFKITNLSGMGSAEISNNSSGRVANKGLEGLAITPDGNTLVAALQAPLIQDGGNSGTNIRFLKYDLTHPTAAPQQLVYQLDSTSTGVSEILAINSHQFLVDERDSNGGSGGVKKLYEIDLNQASVTDVTAIHALAVTGNTSGVTALNKILFANIGTILNGASGAFVSGGNGLPDKIEGYAFGPDLPDGRHLLLATNDDDFGNSYPNYIWAFAVDAATLPNFEAFHANPGVTFVPEPASLGLLTIGALALLRRRTQI